MQGRGRVGAHPEEPQEALAVDERRRPRERPGHAWWPGACPTPVPHVCADPPSPRSGVTSSLWDTGPSEPRHPSGGTRGTCGFPPKPERAPAATGVGGQGLLQGGQWSQHHSPQLPKDTRPPHGGPFRAGDVRTFPGPDGTGANSQPPPRRHPPHPSPWLRTGRRQDQGPPHRCACCP